MVAEGYDIYNNYEQATTGDFTKFGIDVGLTAASTALLFIPGANIVGLAILGVQIANTYGAFDGLYEMLND